MESEQYMYLVARVTPTVKMLGRVVRREGGKVKEAGSA
jgi:hypothetical protein